MNILSIEVDAFGVWTGLKLESLSGGLNVLYGPNEAGKTTLLEFIRSMLYGFAAARRMRYLPMVHGARPGGRLKLSGPAGECQLVRHADEARDAIEGDLKLLAADGTMQTGRVLELMLADVDEATFNNVFAVGLKEVQELGSLDGTAAAELLYRLASGLDRVSLVEVLSELTASRERLLCPDESNDEVTALLTARAGILAEMERLESLSGRYNLLSLERAKIQSAIAEQEAESTRLEQSARVLEAALAVREAWRERQAIEAEMAPLGGEPGLEARAWRQFEAISARVAARRRRIARVRRAREALQSERGGLALDRAVARQAPRIEALLEQETWIRTLESRVDKHQAELAQVEQQLTAEQRKVGLTSETMQSALLKLDGKGPDDKQLAAVRAAARRVRKPVARAREAAAQAARAANVASTLAAEVRSALAGRPEAELTPALQRAGGLVSLMRRRVQIDDRLAQMSRHLLDLESQSRHLLDRQMLPAWVLAGLGGLFVCGVVLILAGLLSPVSLVGSAGWAMAVLGLGGTATAAGAKWMLERAASNQLLSCQKQSGILGLQIKQAKEERDELDAQIPRGGGPLVTRLQTAEKDLAALEDLLSIDGRRQVAQQEAEAAQDRARQARQESRSARQEFHKAASAAGLGGPLNYGQARKLLKAWPAIAELAARSQRLRAELDERRGELAGLVSRVNQVMADVGMTPTSGRAAERLQQLRGALMEHQASASQRLELMRRAARLRRYQRKLVESARQWQRRRQAVMRRAGVKEESDFRAMGEALSRRQALCAARDGLSQRIAASLGNRAGEEEVRGWLEGNEASELEAHTSAIMGRREQCDQQMKELFEARGRVAGELESLAEDRRGAHRLVELAAIDEKLRSTVERWQVLGVTQLVLEEIRRVYEADRQPQTLQEASEYLKRMTEGRYQRVWTPLGESGLRVDDAQGNWLGAESLSRGTREQLFLCLRLALVESYARRGVELPLVLDDVLVNFDARRAKAAAAVLRDFASQGRQVLVFTCHEHVLKLFKSLKVATRRLPAGDEPTLALAGDVPGVEEEDALVIAPVARNVQANSGDMIQLDDDDFFEVQLAGNPDDDPQDEDGSYDDDDDEGDEDDDDYGEEAEADDETSRPRRQQEGLLQDDPDPVDGLQDTSDSLLDEPVGGAYDAEGIQDGENLDGGYSDEADPQQEASRRVHKVIVVRGPRGSDFFSNAVWHEPVEEV